MGAAPLAGLSCAQCHCESGKVPTCLSEAGKSNEMCLPSPATCGNAYPCGSPGPHAEPLSAEEEGGSLESWDSGAGSSGVDIIQAQHVVKNFVRSLVRGASLSLLSVSGGTAECIVSLDRELTTLWIQRAGAHAKRRGVPLEDIFEVIVGECGGKDFNLQTDGMCVTMVLTSGQALAFQFDTEEDRDTFALCFSMFIDARKAELPDIPSRGASPKRV